MEIQQSTVNTTVIQIDHLTSIGYTTYLTSIGVQRHSLTLSGDADSSYLMIDSSDKNDIIDALARHAAALSVLSLTRILSMRPLAA